MKSLQQHLQENLQIDEAKASFKKNDIVTLNKDVTLTSLSELKGKKLKITGFVKTGLISQPEFLKVIDDEKEEYEINPEYVSLNESFDIGINEAENINSDEEFIEYGEKLLKAAHGDDYDQSTADDTLKGILKDADGDYGQAIGVLQSSLSENLNESWQYGKTYKNVECKWDFKSSEGDKNDEYQFKKGQKVDVTIAPKDPNTHFVLMQIHDPKTGKFLGHVEDMRPEQRFTF